MKRANRSLFATPKSKTLSRRRGDEWRTAAWDRAGQAAKRREQYSGKRASSRWSAEFRVTVARRDQATRDDGRVRCCPVGWRPGETMLLSLSMFHCCTVARGMVGAPVSNVGVSEGSTVRNDPGPAVQAQWMGRIKEDGGTGLLTEVKSATTATR